MSKILTLIEQYFPENQSFTANEFSIITNIDTKISAMNLKRLANSKRIGYSPTNNIYWDWGLIHANSEVDMWNNICDTFLLKRYLKKHKK